MSAPVDGANSVNADVREWSKAPLHLFTERKVLDLKNKRKCVRKYYEKQNEWIETIEQLDKMYRDEAASFVILDARQYKRPRNSSAGADSSNDQNQQAADATAGVQGDTANDLDAENTPVVFENERANGDEQQPLNGDAAVTIDPQPSDEKGDKKTKRKRRKQNSAKFLNSKEEEERRLVALIAKGTLLINLLLLVLKIVASVLSGSLSVVSSVVDSAVDLASGIVMWLTTRAVRRRNIYAYPSGRTRLEPLGILILSVVMGLACVQVTIESVGSIKEMADTGQPRCRTTWLEVGILIAVIVTKACMFLGCTIVNRRFQRPSESLSALAQDHRNDVLTNIVAIVGAYVGALGGWLRFFDPVIATVISTYVLVSWCRTGYRHTRRLSGLTASPTVLRTVTWICLNHDPRIREVDTVRGFHLGTNLIMEVDVVLDEHMSLRESHDIGESLQKKIERLPDVELCFVHLDYESLHDPRSEHKQV